MNDAKKSADRTPKLPMELSRRKAAPTESKEYADAVSEGWPISPHPHNRKTGEV
jgi:hypothetical protein